MAPPPSRSSALRSCNFSSSPSRRRGAGGGGGAERENEKREKQRKTPGTRNGPSRNEAPLPRGNYRALARDGAKPAGRAETRGIRPAIIRSGRPPLPISRDYIRELEPRDRTRCNNYGITPRVKPSSPPWRGSSQAKFDRHADVKIAFGATGNART